MNLTMDGATAAVLITGIVCGSVLALIWMTIRQAKDERQ